MLTLVIEKVDNLQSPKDADSDNISNIKRHHMGSTSANGDAIELQILITI